MKKVNEKLYVKKTSFEVFLRINRKKYSTICPFLPQEQIIGKLTKIWNKFPKHIKNQYFRLELRARKLVSKKKIQKKELNFAIASKKSKKSSALSPAENQRSITTSCRATDESESPYGTCGLFEDSSPPKKLKDSKKKTKIPATKSQKNCRRKRKGQISKAPMNQANKKRSKNLLDMEDDSADEFESDMKINFKQKRSVANNSSIGSSGTVEEWLTANETQNQVESTQTYLDHVAEYQVPEVIEENPAASHCGILKPTMTAQKPVGHGGQGRMKVTFSTRQKILPLDTEGSEYSCDVGTTDVQENASSSQEFEKETFSMDIKWEKSRKRNETHDCTVQYSKKAPFSHPLQQQNYQNTILSQGIDDDFCTNKSADQSTPETAKEPSRQLTNAPRKHKIQFEGASKSSRSLEEKKCHLQLFRDQLTKQGNVKYGKENIQAASKGFPKSKKSKKETKQSSKGNKSNSRKALQPSMIQMSSPRYEDDIQVQGFESDENSSVAESILSPITARLHSPVLLKFHSATPSPTLLDSSPETPPGFSPPTPTLEAFPQSHITLGEGTPSKFLPSSAQGVSPKSLATTQGDAALQTLASSDHGLPSESSMVQKCVKPAQRRRALKLYNPEPLMSPVSSRDSQTSQPSQASPPEDLLVTDDFEENNGPVEELVNEETQQIILDLFTDEMPPPDGKRYLLCGSQESQGSSSDIDAWDDDLYG